VLTENFVLLGRQGFAPFNVAFLGFLRHVQYFSIRPRNESSS